MNENKRSVFDSISFYIFQALVFLIPVFFIPSASVLQTTAKASLVIIGSLLLLVFFLIGRIKEGSFSFPRIWAYGSVLILLASYALASFFSGNVSASIFGQGGLDQGSLVFILAAVVLFLLTPLVLDNEEKVFYSYIALFASFFAVALYEALHLIFPAFSLSIFTTATANMIGTWNDLSVFFGLALILSTITLGVLTLSKIARLLVSLCFVASLIFLALINFSQAWIVIAFFGLVAVIYELSFNKNAGGRRFPIHASIVLLISLVFIFFGSPIGSAISNVTGISQTEVRPSWSATFDIASAALKDHTLFGVGPDRFTSAWLKDKPAGINSTLFWATDFGYGIGFLPSLPVTVGLVGALGALAFVVLFLWKGCRCLFAETKTHIGSYLVISSFAASVYLWIDAFIYVPSLTMLSLAFLWSGLFIAVLIVQGIVPIKRFSFIENPIKNFVSILVIVLMLVGALALGYSVATHALAEVYFGQASVVLANSNDLDQGEADVTKAFALAPSALYSRAVADIYLARVSALLQSTTTSQTDAAKQFQSLFAVAVQAGQQSVTLDPTDYQNYLELGKVYGSVVSLKVTGAYDAAKAAYMQALALNPQNPAIYYDLAQLDVANNDNASAEADLTKALKEKNDYADAIYLLSQIYISENKLPAATNAVKALAVLSPSSSGIFFELGLLEYNQKDYADAAQALNQAIKLSPDYANAEYFLGLSDYYLKDTADAVTEFEALAKSNPTNTDVASILANLRAGKAPISAAASTTTVKKGKVSTLPVAQ
jgi:tetratricopeptide (TPR) repeat protein